MEPRGARISVVSLVASTAALLGGVASLMGIEFSFGIPLAGPLGPLVLGLESGMAGAYLLLAGCVGLACTLAGPRDHLDGTGRGLVALFIVGLVLVPLAGDAFTLLLAWELMSASPGLLLVLDAEASKRHAGLLYLAYSQASALLLAAGLLVWNKGGDGAFETLLASPGPPIAMVLILLAALLKAGVMPFHSWLPEAHPAAPGHVSALMSGVMVAMPSYVVLRLVIPAATLPNGAALTTLLLGATSAALASLHALHERDLKRVLALTTVAHMGVLFTVLPLSFLVPASQGPAMASLVLTVVPAYVLAHGLSKGTLFLVAAEIHHATGHVDLERLGGLWRPLGGLAFVAGLGGIALAGLPPFAGFAPEIATFVAIFYALAGVGPIEGVALLGSLFLLALGAGAGLAAIAKVVLGTFHGAPRGARPPNVIPRRALVPTFLLVGLSLLFGLAPGLLWQRLPQGAPDPWSIATPLGSLHVLAIAALAMLLASAVALGFRFAARPRPVEPWATGGPPPTPRQTYTPQALVMPFRILFAEILRPTSDLRIQDAPIAPFAPSKGQYEDIAPRFIEPWVHGPVWRFLEPNIQRLRRFHRGPVQAYLIVALLVLVLLLFLLPVIP